MLPSSQPTISPIRNPSKQPSRRPSKQPSSQPTRQPRNRPSRIPSKQPTKQPTSHPSYQPSSRPSLQPFYNPSSLPSAQPFFHPTGQPTFQPKLFPSGQPTVRPTSSKPTSLPTSHPSKSPITSYPTTRKQFNTKQPSAYPTIHPTANLKNYVILPIYQNYLNATQNYIKGLNSFTYSNFYYKGLYVEGSCNEWTNYATNILSIPADDIYFSKISVSFANLDFVTQQYMSIQTTCTDQNFIQKIVSSLLGRISFSGNCDGNIWRVMICNGYVTLCINCKPNCVKTIACPGKSFIINSCATTCNYKFASSGIIDIEYVKVSLFPMFISPFNVSINGYNNLVISAYLSTSGQLFCAAANNYSFFSYPFNIINNGNSSISDSSNFAVVYLNNLAPRTDYSVVCFTSSFDGHSMDLITSKKYIISVTTKGIGRILLYNSYSTIFATTQGISRLNLPFVIGLNCNPIQPVSIKLLVYQSNCRTGSLSISLSNTFASPSNFLYDSSSDIPGLRSQFLIESNVSGCYVLRAISSNPLDFIPFQNFSFTVHNIRFPPSSPVLTNVLMADDGTYLSFLFDSPTDRGSGVNTFYYTKFSCNLIVLFPGSNSSTCQWIDNSSLMATYYYSEIKPNIGDLAILLPSSIKALCSLSDCSSYKFVPSYKLNISSPLYPLKPTARLSISRLFSFCSDVSIDPTLSQGHGGRNWKSIRWNINSPSISDGITRNISNFLNDHYSSSLTPVVIPNFYFQSSVDYTVSLTIVNFLNQISVVSTLFSIGPDSVGALETKLYSTVSSFYSLQEINIYSVTTVPNCKTLQGSSYSNLTSTWRVYQGLLYNGSIKSVSLDPTAFKLIPYTLMPMTS